MNNVENTFFLRSMLLIVSIMLSVASLSARGGSSALGGMAGGLMGGLMGGAIAQSNRPAPVRESINDGLRRDFDLLVTEVKFSLQKMNDRIDDVKNERGDAGSSRRTKVLQRDMKNLQRRLDEDVENLTKRIEELEDQVYSMQQKINRLQKKAPSRSRKTSRRKIKQDTGSKNVHNVVVNEKDEKNEIELLGRNEETMESLEK